MPMRRRITLPDQNTVPAVVTRKSVKSGLLQDGPKGMIE